MLKPPKIDIDNLYPIPSPEEIQQLKSTIHKAGLWRAEAQKSQPTTVDNMLFNRQGFTVWPFNTKFCIRRSGNDHPNCQVHEHPLVQWDYLKLEQEVSVFLEPNIKVCIRLTPDGWRGYERFHRNCVVSFWQTGALKLSKEQFFLIQRHLCSEFKEFGLKENQITMLSPKVGPYYIDDSENLTTSQPQGYFRLSGEAAYENPPPELDIQKLESRLLEVSKAENPYELDFVKKFIEQSTKELKYRNFINRNKVTRFLGPYITKIVRLFKKDWLEDELVAIPMDSNNNEIEYEIWEEPDEPGYYNAERVFIPYIRCQKQVIYYPENDEYLIFLDDD